MLHDKDLNPFNGFGFKKLFCEEPHKEVLISFLNALLPEKHQIQDLQYTRTERLGLILPFQCLTAVSPSAIS